MTIGNFDGVHRGHQVLIRRLVERAREKCVPAIVMTFEPHPVQVLYPDRKLHRVFSADDLTERMEALGVDGLVIEPFSREFSQLPPERYLLEWVFKPFNPETVVVGYDFSFGAHRQGSIDFLKEHAGALGVRAEVTPPVKVGEVLVSSSRIRQAVEAGDVALAGQLLGRWFYVRGLIEKGAGRGRGIAIPTANLRSPSETLPGRGVYAAWAEVRGERYEAAVNVGFNPTFVSEHGPVPSIEAHLLGFPRAGESEDLYGEELRLEFVSRLRAEQKFPSADALVAQIRADIASVPQKLREAKL